MAHANRLLHETSPYLRQHAHNPVDWHPWDAEALERARREDKPILLSIGYSACHWCHVMEHESFEDEDVARVMNTHFVCIKVDREERPDLDKVYQTAHQLLTQRAGGWPLTVFLAPDDHMPFFAGTYFPKTPRYGMPGFVELLERVARAWREQRDAIRAQNRSLREVYARLNAGGEGRGLGEEVLARAVAELAGQYDRRHGGFGGAPKFPHASGLALLLCRPQDEARTMARHTLAAMARGGIYDQIGGGFFRYSVDERWEIPHFEKMLYDNAQLLPLYAEVAAVDHDPRAREVAEETATWMIQEMQSPEGGFYATLDADSEGHEGRYYVWDRDQIRTLLTPAEYAVIERRFALDQPANFEDRWHLHARTDVADIARDLDQDPAEVEALLGPARARLYAARADRIRPARDEKILTSWNGLAIAGLARSGRLLARPDLVAAAERAAEFVRARLWRDGRLYAVTKDGRTRLNAYLDDHVLLIDGLLALLAARWRTEDLELARALADIVLERFQDASGGGFYFTADDHETLIHRPKPATDEALPAGNGVAAQVLLRLGHLLGEPACLDAAERTLNAFQAQMTSYPSACASLLIALDEYLHPPAVVILRGKERELGKWRERLRERFPLLAVYAIPDEVQALPAPLEARRNLAAVTGYLCRGRACQPPVTDVHALERQLAER
jgi:uncharacterized protein YyaL (SSP411 family)